jgi:hypothetical protein
MRAKHRYHFLLLLIIFTPASLLPGRILAEDSMTVYKSPTCGCCKKWVSYLEKNNFKVAAHDVSDVVPYKINAGLPAAAASCHTAFIGGYVIEGHVPAADIRRLLKERPVAKGLAVPGMPIGSPGMEQGNHKQHYQVLLIHRDGTTSVFSSH